MPPVPPTSASTGRTQIEGYDRAAASRILADVAAPGLFPATVAAGDHLVARTISYRLAPLSPVAGSHLTAAQLDYLSRFMAPATPADITSATHRVTWDDSAGIPNVGYCIDADGWGPVVPVVARETVLALWRALADDPRHFEHAGAGLTAAQRRTLAATTTDIEPLEIFRIGVEAASRALMQHALLAATTPHRSPATLARAMATSGIFATVAATWYWELQASTSRRGMIPVAFDPTGPDGRLRYSDRSIEVLAAMKAATIANTRRVMAEATSGEGLSVQEAVERYHHERDEIPKQYALLPEGEAPRCLGLMSHDLAAGPFSVLPGTVDAFVSVFCRLLDLTTVEPAHGREDRLITEQSQRTFHVPDMNCQHCKATITGVLEAMAVTDIDVDLVTKRITAGFATEGERERAFDAIRDGGYTVIPPGRA